MSRMLSVEDQELWLRRIFAALARTAKNTTRGFPSDSIIKVAQGALDTNEVVPFAKADRKPKPTQPILRSDIDLAEIALRYVSHLPDDSRSIFWDRLGRNLAWSFLHHKYGKQYSLVQIKRHYSIAVTTVALRTLNEYKPPKVDYTWDDVAEGRS